MVPIRTAVAAGVVAVVIAVVTTALVTLGLTGRIQPEVSRPSPTPTPTLIAKPTLTPETPTPTPSPTVAPTPTRTASPQPTRTPMPDPTTNVAGQQLIPYYFQARQVFPIFPPTPQIDFDFAADRDGDAFCRGLTPTGQPIFTVRQDFVMTQRTAFHEIGHAYEELLKRKDASVDWRARYWAFRGFPGTWQQAAQEAATKTGMSQWISQPQESWAEAFSVAMVGGGSEKTLDYGRTINPSTMKAFFMSLLN
ncbi:MAG: hypothetical protein ACRDF9_13515 [Candidatus Limnocylindria bacterium]